MTKVTDPIKLEEARARMAKARAARASMKHPDSVKQRVGTVRQLVVRQFTDAGLSAADDGKLLGADSPRYYYNKLVKGSLTLKDMILLGDYMPIDWTLIFKSVRQPKMFCGLSMLRQCLSTWGSQSQAITHSPTTSLKWTVHDGTKSVGVRANFRYRPDQGHPVLVSCWVPKARLWV